MKLTILTSSQSSQNNADWSPKIQSLRSQRQRLRMRSRDSSPSGDLSSVIDLKYLDQSNVFQMPKPETTVLRARSNSISEERVNIAAKVRVFPFVVQFRSLLTGLVLWLSFPNYLIFIWRLVVL